MTDLLQSLKLANRSLDELCRWLTPSDSPPAPRGPDDLADALAGMLQVGERLEMHCGGSEDPELADAIGQYRDHLERLRVLLPALQAHLLTERARLESERSHLEAATAWSEASRSTT